MAPPHLHRHLPTFRSLYTLSLYPPPPPLTAVKRSNFSPLTLFLPWSACPPLSVPRRWLLLAELVLTTQRRWLAPLRNGWSEKLKNESFDQNPHGYCEKIQSLDEKTDGFCEEIQSLNHSKLKSESLDETPYRNCEKIQSLNNLKQKSESLDENPYRK
ncbi:hypothetical protein Hanom_Chr01g00010641 [Helianthus anomalus]